MAWCVLFVQCVLASKHTLNKYSRILIYPQGSPKLARAVQTADGDLKCEPPVLHLVLFPGSGSIP
jgi:hypothetical protein